MKSMLILILFNLGINLYTQTKFLRLDTSKNRYEYVNVAKDFEKVFPKKIEYCHDLVFNSFEFKNLKIKRMNEILSKFDTINTVSFIQPKDYVNCYQIPMLSKVKEIIIYLYKHNDTCLFSLKNIESLSIKLKSSEILSIPKINSNITMLSTASQFDSTLLNLINLDTLRWVEYDTTPDFIGQYIVSKHSHLFYLIIVPAKYYTSKKMMNSYINILRNSKSIKQIQIDNMYYEIGAMEMLKLYCEENKIKLILPVQWFANSIENYEFKGKRRKNIHF